MKLLVLLRYCELRDSDKAFYIYKDCSRKWMNQNGPDENGKEIGSSGINILWPNVDNQHFKDALKTAKEGGSPNNISPHNNLSNRRWGKISMDGRLGKLNSWKILKTMYHFQRPTFYFAPHHGRESG